MVLYRAHCGSVPAKRSLCCTARDEMMRRGERCRVFFTPRRLFGGVSTDDCDDEMMRVLRGANTNHLLWMRTSVRKHKHNVDFSLFFLFRPENRKKKKKMPNIFRFFFLVCVELTFFLIIFLFVLFCLLTCLLVGSCSCCGLDVL